MGDEGVDFDICLTSSFRCLSSLSGEVVDILGKSKNEIDRLKL